MRGPNDLAGDFGTMLRVHRTSRRLTQEELASLSGLSVRAIADMERGRTLRPYPNSVRRLAEALRLSGPERQQLGRAARSAWTELGWAPADDGAADGQAVDAAALAAPRQDLAGALLHSHVDALTLLAKALVTIAGTGGTITVSPGAAEDCAPTAVALHWVLGPADSAALMSGDDRTGAREAAVTEPG